MKEYNSILLDDTEVQTLLDISQLTNRPVKPVPLPNDLDPTRDDSTFGEAFWFEDNHVVGLLFMYSFLKTLPKSIGNLTYLRYLIIYDSPIQNIPSTLKNLHNLELIKFVYDPEVYPRVALDFPDIFQDLKSLNAFHIDGLFEIYIPPSFIELKNLIELTLEGCVFFTNYIKFKQYLCDDTRPSGINALPKDLSKMKSLKTLVLKNLNGLEFPTSIINQDSLKELVLSKTENIKNLDIAFNIKSLEKLNLSGCQLHYIPKTISNLVNLKSLDISQNYLQDIPFELTKCKNLEKIDLTWNMFEKKLTVLSSLNNLRIIIFDKGNRKIIPKKLFKKKNLELQEF